LSTRVAEETPRVRDHETEEWKEQSDDWLEK